MGKKLSEMTAEDRKKLRDLAEKMESLRREMRKLFREICMITGESDVNKAMEAVNTWLELLDNGGA
jgi:hypothetical protein